MKSIKYFLGAIFAMALVGCTDDATNDDPSGSTDGDSSTGTELYFSDELNSSFTVSADDMTFEFIASRTIGTTAATYEFEVISDDGGYVIFDSTEVSFAAGETEAVITGELYSGAPQGYVYYGAVAFTNADYAAIYKPTTFEFSIDFPYTWELVVGDNGETVGKYIDDIFYSLFTGVNPEVSRDIAIYEAKEKPGYYRMPNVYNPDYIAALVGGDASDYEPYVEYGYILYGCTDDDPLYSYVDASDPENVFFPWQTTGFYFQTGYGYVNFASYSNLVFPSYLTEEDSINGVLENNIMSFGKGALYIEMDEYTTGAFMNITDTHAVHLPGASEMSNILGITFDYNDVNPTAGTAIFDFEVDDLVASIKYAVVEYDEEADYTTIVSAIKAGTQSGIVTITSFDNVTVAAGNSGTYSLVAVPYDVDGASGKFNEDTCVVSFRMIEGSEVALGLASGYYAIDYVTDTYYSTTYTDLEFKLTRATEQDYVYYSTDFLGFGESIDIVYEWILSEEDMKVYVTPYSCMGTLQGFLVPTFYAGSESYVYAFAGSGGNTSTAAWEINIALNDAGDGYDMTTFATYAYNNIYYTPTGDDVWTVDTYYSEGSYIKPGTEVNAVSTVSASATQSAPVYTKSGAVGMSFNNTDLKATPTIGTVNEKRKLSSKSL